MSDNRPLLPARPPRKRATQQRAIDTIKVVIEATIRMIVEGGESSVNVKEISEQTGVSYGAIYHHFGDRDGLVRAAQFERLRNQPGGDIVSLSDALDHSTDLVDFVARIRSITDAIADPSRADVRLVRSSVIASSTIHPDLREALTSLESGVMEQVAGLVQRAQEAGIADESLDPRAAAVYIEALSYGIVLMEFMENRPSPELVSEMLLRGFMALLAPGH